MLSVDFCQTPPQVWTALLEKCPIDKDEVFYEPFKGVGNLYNQVQTNKKYFSEINEGLDAALFNYETNNDITVIYTNPPFKCELTNKKGIKKIKNCVYYWLEFFMQKCVSLKKIGFLMNTACLQSLTPKRLKKLDELGFSITKIIVLNIQIWFGRYYWVLFEKNQTNKLVEYIADYF